VTAYLNGEFLDADACVISALDRGFLFGDSVYEVLPIYRGTVFRCEDHLRRLDYSLTSVGIDNPKSDAKWKAVFSELIKRSGLTNLSIYLQISRGQAPIRAHRPVAGLRPTVFVMTMPEWIIPEEMIKGGARVITAKDVRWGRCDIKSTNLLANVMLGMQPGDNTIYEVIMIDGDYVTEGTSSNVFIVRNHHLYTPPLSAKVLAGITRKVVIEIASQLQIPCTEKNLRYTDLLHADEIWLSSSTRNIVSVTNIDKQQVGTGKPGEVWSEFSAALIKSSVADATVL